MTGLLTSRARLATSASVLNDIGAPDCNLAVWQREAFADFAPLLVGEPRDLRFVSTPIALESELVSAMAANGYGGEPALHRVFARDAAHLAALFCAAMDLSAFELRLEVVRTDSCRKFHADYVTARLITTYVGEGTDWLEDAEARRLAEGREPQRINRLATFDVGLFKGRLGIETPAIHRSPPIAGTGAVRLMLVLNPAEPRFVDVAQSPLPPGHHIA